MEGIIPLVLKTFKKNRTRSHYEYLSSGVASAAHHQRYNISDFYQDDDPVTIKSNEEIKVRNLQKSHQSFHYESSDSANKKELVRFRSHRRMFSCMPGY
ncbi:hypothetical protein LIER_15108 [Lithospermum erythrorhizon]|uniref:Uncharacterized protein n=1 Tax=Lithospermum erythrorhizon TaxID=34254 RepID=A0AAV3Q2K2_LITER